MHPSLVCKVRHIFDGQRPHDHGLPGICTTQWGQEQDPRSAGRSRGFGVRGSPVGEAAVVHLQVPRNRHRIFKLHPRNVHAPLLVVLAIWTSGSIGTTVLPFSSDLDPSANTAGSPLPEVCRKYVRRVGSIIQVDIPLDRRLLFKDHPGISPLLNIALHNHITAEDAIRADAVFRDSRRFHNAPEHLQIIHLFQVHTDIAEGKSCGKGHSGSSPCRQCGRNQYDPPRWTGHRHWSGCGV